MTDEQINPRQRDPLLLRLMSEAFGSEWEELSPEQVKFAELVAAHEREQCARAVEAMDPGDGGSPWMVPRPVECAAAIRALQQLAADAQELGMGY